MIHRGHRNKSRKMPGYAVIAQLSLSVGYHDHPEQGTWMCFIALHYLGICAALSQCVTDR